jgi:predicted RNA-binding protein with RPS1 domain
VVKIAPVNSEIEVSKGTNRDLNVDITKNDNINSASDIPTTEKRQRGKKRKGRKDTSDALNNVDKENDQKSNSSEKDSNNTECDATTKEDLSSTKKRRCIGRKPVTDFVVGQTYTGKVVYIKPFGVFVDIGCHSDAFCHVSRVSDNFVESIESMFKIGDDITSARVIDVNRKAKRITVSLQSENRLNDEMASMKSWKERMEKRENKKANENDATKATTTNVQTPDNNNDKKKNNKQNVNNNNKTIDPIDSNKEVKRTTIEESSTPTNPKRARKIARRAERREKAAKTEITTG